MDKAFHPWSPPSMKTKLGSESSAVAGAAPIGEACKASAHSIGSSRKGGLKSLGFFMVRIQLTN